MRAQDREGSDTSQPLKPQPHEQWADKLSALYHAKLPDAEREQVEAHLKDCEACSEMYLVYRGITEIRNGVPRLEAPLELPPALQQLKAELLAQEAQTTPKHERPASPKQTLRAVTGKQAQKKRQHPA